jgi:hypothetical protein
LRRRHRQRLWGFTLDAPSDVDAATSNVLRRLFGNGATSSYAKGVGLVLTEASGPWGTTSMRLRRCSGS